MNRDLNGSDVRKRPRLPPQCVGHVPELFGTRRYLPPMTRPESREKAGGAINGFREGQGQLPLVDAEAERSTPISRQSRCTGDARHDRAIGYGHEQTTGPTNPQRRVTARGANGMAACPDDGGGSSSR
ncbi:hypothetical protein SKAU_G00053770 [Synaphobranchus kaupii]|uniref:Uncharacterized protein n=1 Tax=Synaphobranchus kaupii TaxID=118154 RepID=A0A9Q1G3J1_SYNKA|nr:hypothetical protein SKAU_G00053770 [Synaphobranchus kaupii]